MARGLDHRLGVLYRLFMLRLDFIPSFYGVHKSRFINKSR